MEKIGVAVFLARSVSGSSLVVLDIFHGITGVPSDLADNDVGTHTI